MYVSCVLPPASANKRIYASPVQPHIDTVAAVPGHTLNEHMTAFCWSLFVLVAEKGGQYPSTAWYADGVGVGSVVGDGEGIAVGAVGNTVGRAVG